VTRKTLLAVAGVLLLATLLRFHLLEAQSFWNDEGNSARLSERSIPAILEGTASDVHPPLYYLLLRGWRELAGETEFGLRAFSAFAGVLSVAAAVAIARQVAKQPGPRASGRTGYPFRGKPPAVLIVAGLLAAVSPVLVYYSQETRMYALLALLALLSAWVLGLWLRTPQWRYGVAYVLLLAAGLYTHYFFPAIIAGQGLVVLLWAAGRVVERPMRRVAVWAGMVLVAAALYLPWLPVFLRQIGGRAGDRAAPLEFLGEVGRWLALGPTTSPETARWFGLAAAGLVALGVLAARRRAIAPLVLAAVPVGFSLLAGATDPAFFKFLLTGVAFLCVLGGLAFSGPRSRPETDRGVGATWSAAAGTFLAVYLAGAALSLNALYTEPAYARADYRGMAARIAADGHPDAGIILVAPNQWEAFTYYHRDGAPVYPLPRGQADPAVIEPELEQIAAAHERLYALYWGEGQRDPDRVVERWLDAHTFKASEEWVGDVRFVIYAVPPPEDGVFAEASDVTFSGLDGETIRLTGVGVRPETVLAGDIVQVQLLWTAGGPTARPYKVFLHLVDGEGQLVAQRDSEPAGGSRPTTGWQAGEVITDNHGLLIPPGTAPGEYELRLGLYDAFDPSARLPAEPSAGDYLVLGRLTVR
jgi:hypothetical protein